MKEMIKRVREEKGGFTLAELLIVVAIILVLVAIAIPVFTGVLSNANLSVARADIRSVKAQAATAYLLNGEDGSVMYSATVDRDGNVSDFQVVGSGTVTTAESIQDQVGGDQPVTIVVEITAADVNSVTTP